MVKMDVLGGYYYMVIIMLEVCQLVKEFSLVVVVNEGNYTRDSFARLPLLLYQLLPD